MASRIRILGIDPGSRHTGYGVIEAAGSRLVPIAWGRFSPPPRAELARRLAFLAASLHACLEEFRPAEVAVETPFHGVNAKSLVVLAQARGALLGTLGAAEIPVREYSPAEVKSAVASNGRADKTQVARMVRMLLGADVQKASEDASDALALAICHAHSRRLQALSARP